MTEATVCSGNDANPSLYYRSITRIELRKERKGWSLQMLISLKKVPRFFSFLQKYFVLNFTVLSHRFVTNRM